MECLSINNIKSPDSYGVSTYMLIWHQSAPLFVSLLKKQSRITLKKLYMQNSLRDQLTKNNAWVQSTKL